MTDPHTPASGAQPTAGGAAPREGAAGHAVLRLWVRPRAGGPMEARDQLQLTAGQGVVGDHTYGRMRHVTIVFEDDWNAAGAELGRAVDPAGRRANVLVSGGGGRHYVGRTLRLGDVRVEIKGITAPCPVMEQAAEGLRAALEPDGRAGVWGRVLDDGELVPGQQLRAERD